MALSVLASGNLSVSYFHFKKYIIFCKQNIVCLYMKHTCARISFLNWPWYSTLNKQSIRMGEIMMCYLLHTISCVGGIISWLPKNLLLFCVSTTEILVKHWNFHVISKYTIYKDVSLLQAVIWISYCKTLLLFGLILEIIVEFHYFLRFICDCTILWIFWCLQWSSATVCCFRNVMLKY